MMIKNQLASFLIIGIVLLIVFLFFRGEAVSPGADLKENTPEAEILAIKATTDLKEQTDLYKKLIERVGPVEAQEELFKSGLPFTGETHLLNHIVGDYLYEKFGPKGLSQCRDYFLSSCYHGFILHAISDGGMTKVSETFNECKKSGPSVYNQCAHAIGHGFLVNAGYRNLPQALKTCDTAGNTTPGFPVFNCYDGVFMENVWGVHDGKPSPDRWVKAGDVQYPCNDPRIDPKYRTACWSNQPSLVFGTYAGDIKKVADDLCFKVKDPEYQSMCFDGLARQIHPITQGNPVKTFELCGLMPTTKWQNFCLVVNATAGYSVGDRETPFQICADISADGKLDCYNRLFSMMRAYAKPEDDLKSVCKKVSDSDFRKQCEKRQ